MRKRSKNQGISISAISGTYVVMLGLDVTAARRKGLPGFAIHREDRTEKEEFWLKGFRTFKETAAGLPPGTMVSTQEHPVQSFFWGDFTAKSEHTYTYAVVPMYGTPKKLVEGPRVEITIETSSEDKGKHSIFFNRGVAGSQAYARKFGNVSPDKIKDPKKQKLAYQWLSRGLEEAMLGYIAQAKGKRFGLRASVYEFNHLPVLKAFGAAAKSKADVKIIYDRRARGPFEATEKAIAEAGIGGLMIPRKTNSAISHNKFIVLLEDGKPTQVWTGSTNFTEGGIFGQSNVGHIIRDEDIARQYLDYWTRLSTDPDFKTLRPANDAASPTPEGLPKAGTLLPIFSPRKDLGALEWYAERMGEAEQFVGFTAAFGIAGKITPILLAEKAFLRYLMVESEGSKKGPKGEDGEDEPKSQFEIFQDIKKVKNNRVAKGSIFEVPRNKEVDDAVGSELHRWLFESLSDLNKNVKYLHTKYLLIDALGDNPTVISGSANFSAASTLNNDENMMVIQGDKDLADMFLGEFMRLFNHFYFREVANAQAAAKSGKEIDKSIFLVPDDSWTAEYFDDSNVKALERKLLR